MSCLAYMCTYFNTNVELRLQGENCVYTQYTDFSLPLKKTSCCQGHRHVHVGGLPPSLHIRGPALITIISYTNSRGPLNCHFRIAAFHVYTDKHYKLLGILHYVFCMVLLIYTVTDRLSNTHRKQAQLSIED